MSGYGTDGQPVGKERDPVVRFLLGCAVVALIFVAIVVCVAIGVGWNLTRDETPGHALEVFLVGDETRYWRFDLKPNDAGLAAFFARLDAINDETRRNALSGTFLEGIPFPHRRAQLEALAPFTLELSLFTSSPAKELKDPPGWAARATFSHGMFKMRAALKMMRFFASRDREKGNTSDVDGIAVTEVRGDAIGFAVATVGNRMLVANDAARMRSVLRTVPATPIPALSELLALHDAIKLDGEDAWAFFSGSRAGDFSMPRIGNRAAASFDVNERDELAFRIIVEPLGAIEEKDPFGGTPEDCSSVVSMFLPGVPVGAIAIDGDGARPSGHFGMEFSGRIDGLSNRLAELLGRASESRDRTPEPSATETPFATPTPPSPPQPVGHRTGTPSGPTHAGSPKPPR